MDASLDLLIDALAAEVSGRIAGTERPAAGDTASIPVGVSARHVHLSRPDLDTLFGPGYRLGKSKDLSQPGQFAALEKVTVVGPGGRSLESVRILGPERKRSQVEISATDARTLGVDAPVRESGDLSGSGPITLVGPKGAVALREGAIVARRHIHFTPRDAERFGVADKDVVAVEIDGPRGGVLGGVVCRVSPDFALELHIDTDEANAFGVGSGGTARILSGK